VRTLSSSPSAAKKQKQTKNPHKRKEKCFLVCCFAGTSQPGEVLLNYVSNQYDNDATVGALKTGLIYKSLKWKLLSKVWPQLI
jgi:hypothetical protein